MGRLNKSNKLDCLKVYCVYYSTTACLQVCH